MTGYAKITETALRELTPDELLLYAVAAALTLSNIATQLGNGAAGVKGFSAPRQGLTDDEVDAQQVVGLRVARRCKELVESRN